MEKTVSLISLGCSKNLVDSEVMLGLLQGAGYRITTDAGEADAIIVNTCGFLGAAVEESLTTLDEVASLKQDGRCKAVVATGCLPQRDAQLIKMRVPGVDAILGTTDFPRIVATLDSVLEPKTTSLPQTPVSNGNGLIQLSVTPTPQHRYVYDHITPRVRATPPWTAYLKIAEGCDHTCSFCIIPQLRGPFRSRPMESIVAEARRLSESGAREIVLVAQDSTRYGIDLYKKWALGGLLRELSQIETVDWLRVLYAYPSQVNDEFIEALCTAPRVARYLDIPLQHASREVLARMRRGGHAESYARLLDRFRSLCPEMTIRTSFIVGFPGETEAQFQELCDFVKAQKFDRIGVFKYSDEDSALSHGLDSKVPPEVKDERYHILQTLQQKISLKKNREFIGKTLDVLLENEEPGGTIGRSQRDAPDIDGNVFVKMTPRERRQHLPGSLVPVRITGASEYDLSGKLA
ncbi:MAG: 30S ribosomal protein S12 methylthiotransferase RimO [Abitibacteriaceae bacterium]|nr:30S ribosomal protein S12 methylthiotransferase RimO [Abditibacteriaceae bacterium]MBV9867929.1 30S ribosomal protein S12 methylthiotransferase RimO [Abditibacteriaceae bacterium]